MSCLVFLPGVDSFRHRSNRHKNKKSSVKTRLDPSQLRLQRILYIVSLRSNKRDLILEEKRHVLEKINWTIAWDDEEDDELERINVSEQDIVTAFVRLSSNLETNLTELLYCLDLLRKMLEREMKSKFGEISCMRQETPGPLAQYLLLPEVFEVVVRLGILSSTRSFSPAIDLSVSREVTSILKEITRFKVECRQLLAQRTDILSSLMQVLSLDDDYFDLICHSNTFFILHNTVQSYDLNPENLDAIGLQLTRHLTRVVTLYGPEDQLIQTYIKNITLFMTSFVNVVSEKMTCRSVENPGTRMSNFFHSSLSCLTQLVQFNDPEVTTNVLSFLQKTSQISIAAEMVIRTPSLIDFLLKMSLPSHPQSDLPLDILSHLSSRQTDFAARLASHDFFSCLTGHMTRASFSVARLLNTFCSLGPQIMEQLVGSCHHVLRHFLEEALFFGEKKTQKEVVSLLHRFADSADLKVMRALFDKELAEMMKGCLSQEDPALTHLILDTFFSIVRRSSPQERSQFVKETAPSLQSSIEEAYFSTNQAVAEAAANLLDFYLTE